MAKQNTTKKHIVTSFHNLTPELQDAVKEKYPLGFTAAMMRVDKPNGDDNAQEEDDMYYYDDEI